MVRYAELLVAERKLHCLEAGGVDNWESYSESLSDHGFWEFEEKIEKALAEGKEIEAVGETVVLIEPAGSS